MVGQPHRPVRSGLASRLRGVPRGGTTVPTSTDDRRRGRAAARLDPGAVAAGVIDADDSDAYDDLALLAARACRCPVGGLAIRVDDGMSVLSAYGIPTEALHADGLLAVSSGPDLDGDAAAATVGADGDDDQAPRLLIDRPGTDESDDGDGLAIVALAPVRWAHQRIGVVFAAASEAARPTDEDLRALTAVRDRVEVAIRTRGLLDRLGESVLVEQRMNGALSIYGDVLRRIAVGASVGDCLGRLCRGISELDEPDVAAALVTAPDVDGQAVTAPDLPSTVVDALEHLRTSGSSWPATSDRRRALDVVTELDERGDDEVAGAAARAGFRSAVALPVRKEDGATLATLMVFDRRGREPSVTETSMLIGAADVAAIAIERGLSDRRLRRLATIIDRVHDAITILDPASLRVLFANRAASRLLGRDLDDILGATPWELDDRVSEASIRREFGPVLDRHVQVVRLRRVFPAGDDDRIETEATVQRIDDVVVAVLRDVTDTLRAVRALRDREERFRQLTDAATDGIYILDLEPERRFRYVNAAFARMLGFTPEDFYADPDLTRRHLHPGDTGALDRARADPDQATYPVVLRWSHPDGRELELEVREVGVRDGRDRIVGLYGYVADVTRRRREQASLRTALAHEREASERLRRVDDLRQAFLAAVSHELRTPLASVVGYSETLRRHRGRLGDDQVDLLLTRLVHNGQRLERLLTDLLDVDRLTKAEVTPHRRRTDIARLVADVLAHLEHPQHPVEVEVPAIEVMVDGPKVERIVDNLVRNALKHTPAGTRIRIVGERAPGGVLLTVEDTGPGIDDALKDRVFHPFEQGARSRRSASPGTGIGLSLVARLAELHGGRAWVEDRPGGGSRFRVLLPEHDPAGTATADRSGPVGNRRP